MNDIEYLINWNTELSRFDDEQEAVEVHERCIQALKFNKQAKELLEACVSLLECQDEAYGVVNLLEEELYYNDFEGNGLSLMNDIKKLLKGE